MDRLAGAWRRSGAPQPTSSPRRANPKGLEDDLGIAPLSIPRLRSGDGRRSEQEKENEGADGEITLRIETFHLGIDSCFHTGFDRGFTEMSLHFPRSATHPFAPRPIRPSWRKKAHRLPYYRINLIVLGICTFLASASWTPVVPFLPVYLNELGAGARLLEWSGLVYSAQYVAGIVMAPLWGRLADRHGRKLMAIRAGLCLERDLLLDGVRSSALARAPASVSQRRAHGLYPRLHRLDRHEHAEGARRALRRLGADDAGPRFRRRPCHRRSLGRSLRDPGLSVSLRIGSAHLGHPRGDLREANKVRPGEQRSFWQDTAAALHSPVLLRVMGITPCRRGIPRISRFSLCTSPSSRGALRPR